MQERRDSFRVEDRAAIWLMPSDRENLEQHQTPREFGLEVSLNLLEELRELEQLSLHQLSNIAELDQHLSSYLRTLNKRIELLSRLVTQQAEPEHSQFLPITLSADGFSCDPDHLGYQIDLKAGQLVAIKLLLAPGSVLLICYGEVIYAPPHPSGRLAIRFMKMPEAQHCRLQRHLFDLQARQRAEQNLAPGLPSAAGVEE